MEAYLDNSATTRVYKEVAELTAKIMLESYGNPSSRHGLGIEAEKLVSEALSVIAGSLKCEPKEIIITSGGTEADNMALIGAAEANSRRGKHIITTCIEHHGVSEPLKYLSDRGYEVTYLSVDKQGIIDLEELQAAIRPDTILVSIMHTNNEIGSMQPLKEAGALIKAANPNILFHTDAVQGYGKFKIYPKKLNIDLLSVSAHKLHGPKGIGFLYAGSKVKINPIIFGGGQQRGLRSGTENVPGIVGMAKAVSICYENLDNDIKRMYELKEYFIKGALNIEDIIVNGALGEQGAPHIISLSIRGIRAEVLLNALSERNIYISSGSACSTNRPAISPVLKAIGLEKDLLDTTLRFSLSTETTKEELDYALDSLRELIPMYRRYKRH